MPTRSDWQAALAICAAIIGAGFASGREIVSFFSCFGAASFFGAAAASAGVGALVYAVMLLSARTRSATFPALYGALMGNSCQDAVSVLHGLMCLITASAMLAAGGELGALTFPVRHSYGLGFGLTLLLGISAVLTGLHTLSFMGALLIPLSIAYFAGMALAGRYSIEYTLSGLAPSIPMGLLYASFNGAIAGGTICLAGQKDASPARTAQLTALLMFLLISCANLAMLRAGSQVRQMNMPSIVLAAGWGVFGYYASIAVLWLAVLSTLCAMLHSLSVQLACLRCRNSVSVLICSVSAALLSVCGFRTLVDAVYPLLGWVCGFALVALMLFLPGSDEKSA